MIRRLSALAICASLSLMPLTSKARQNVDGIVAVVNGEAITFYDVMTFNAFTEMRLRKELSGKELSKALETSRKEAANRLVENKLVHKEFEAQGFQVPRELLEERLDKMVVERAGGSRTDFARMVKETGQTFDEFKKQLTESIAVEMMINQFVYQTVTIEDEAIEEYYNKNKSDFFVTSEIDLSLLGLKDPSDEDKVNLEIASGTTFADCVKKYSSGPNKDKGGSLGWRKMKDLRKEFKEAVIGKAKNTVIGPVKVETQSFLLYINDFKKGHYRKLDSIVKSGITRHLRIGKEKEAYKAYIKNLKERSIVRTNY